MYFTASFYRNICSFIAERQFNTVLAKEIVGLKTDSSFICIKHDVECKPSSALKIAKIESEYGIRSTFFFQSYLIASSKEIIKSISDLGHEIAYHYDVLDACNGDFDFAISKFNESIHQFQDEGFEIESVCPHGNPTKSRNGWASNKDFFRKLEIRALYPSLFDIVIDINVLGSNTKYISDAGYTFKFITDVSENDRKNIPDVSIEDFNALANAIIINKRLIISTHPHRWSTSKLNSVLRTSAFFISKKIATLLIKSSLGSYVLNKLYKFAKFI